MTPTKNSPSGHTAVGRHLGDDRLVDLALAEQPLTDEATHLEGCATCADALASLVRTVDVTRGAAGTELVSPPSHVWTRIQDELDEIGQAFSSLERMVRRGQADGSFRSELDPKIAAWMLYGALEEVLTGWVLGQLPDDAAAVGAAEREVTATIVGGLRA